MSLPTEFVSPTAIAEQLSRAQVISPDIRPLWEGARLSGPAYTVQCAPGDNLMLHAAIHRAPPGSVVVVHGGDDLFAVAGGNVCAVAQRRGIAGFVIDGAIRDVQEIRDLQFPVFARTVVPKPGMKNVVIPLQNPVVCGGVLVNPGDHIVADEEGIVAVPSQAMESVFTAVAEKASLEAAQTIDDWGIEHEQKINAILSKAGVDW